MKGRINLDMDALIRALREGKELRGQGGLSPCGNRLSCCKCQMYDQILRISHALDGRAASQGGAPGRSRRNTMRLSNRHTHCVVFGAHPRLVRTAAGGLRSGFHHRNPPRTGWRSPRAPVPAHSWRSPPRRLRFPSAPVKSNGGF